MAISRSLMNRQLRADGGIMQVAPREKFGLGSKLKKFVRKIIPNEVADIAVKAAPFVAPFNPAVASAMSGLGTFDQTGSIGQSLKGAGMNYAGGQAARYLGGADFQGNPFDPGGAFRGGLEGFKGGFSSPLGNQTGFKLGQPVQEVQGVGVNSEGSYLPFQGEEMNIPSYSEQLNIIQKGSPNQMTITESIQKILSPNTTINEKGGEALNLLKRGTKAAFTKPDGKGGTTIDKAAVIGAVTFATSYAEAKALANEAGVEITEEEYDEATKADKQAEYAGYLQNFFAGKKDGGRIGFARGTEETSLPMESLIKLLKGDIDEGRGAMDEEMEKTLNIKDAMAQSNDMRFLNELMNDLDGKYDEDEKDFYYKSIVPQLIRSGEMTYEDGMKLLNELLPEMRAAGGRIGFRKGSDKEVAGIEAALTVDDDVTTYSDRPTRKVNEPDEKGILEKTGDYLFNRGPLGYTTKSIGAVFDEMPEGSKMGDRRFFIYNALLSPAVDALAALGFGIDIATDIIGDAVSMGAETVSDIVEFASRAMPGDQTAEREAKRKQPAEDMLAVLEAEKKAQGGRIGLRKGTDPEGSEIGIMTIDVEAGDDEDMEDIDDMLMAYSDAVFTRDEKSRLFRALGNPAIRQTTKSFKNLDTILKNPGMFPNDEMVLKEFLKMKKADGGRIKYAKGANRVSELLILRDEKIAKGEDVTDIEAEIFQLTGKEFKSVGGISNVPTGKIRKNSAGVKERDYRDEGGFVPVGIKEKADDVPAMLSKNEFVITADAVRGIGGGNVEKGSKKLYNLMKNAEQVGRA